MIKHRRTTKETDIAIELDMTRRAPARLDTGLPFFNHILTAMAFHGGFQLEIDAKGDIEVDPHHLVEDCGLVLGKALELFRQETGGIARYGEARIPMDDALSEAVVDACGRPYLVYHASLPQTHAGNFDLSLLREFWLGLAMAGKMNLHLHVRYAENAHHAVEALFKAAGRALAQAYRPINGTEEDMSTKGKI
ncbi:MAG: imidazoleglycerol-phosphate dehydratase [Spirochaeta sp. LUC14_002_19_P3]|nr:MAG: imidazoleglycerol-phosphate dehydratase [Spirochaeta sp. LUC14_002_19_P3]